MNSVSHHTAAPIGRVIKRAVPANVPAIRGGHTNSAYCQCVPKVSMGYGKDLVDSELEIPRNITRRRSSLSYPIDVNKA